MAKGLSVEVNIAGSAGFMRKLTNLGTTLYDFHEALDETGKGLEDYFSGQVFDSMGGVLGTPWQALSPSTVAYKSQHFRSYAAVPLMRTGTMRESFEHSASATHLEVTNSADYFKYHQSTEPRKKIPRRPMMGINRDVKEIIRRAFNKAMHHKLGRL